MASIHVFQPAEVIEAIEAKPDSVVNIREKKFVSKNPNPKVKYLDLIIKTKNHEGPAIFAIGDDEGNTKIVYGLRDPAETEDDDEQRKLSVSTTVADGGEFGRMMELLAPLFDAEIERCIAEKIIVKGKRNVKSLINTHYSEDRADEKAGTPFDSPIINFKIDFSKYPATYPRSFMRGQQKTMIHDYTSTYKDAKGRTQYNIAKTEDGVALDETNAHEFVKSDSMIMKGGRIHMEAVCISQSWISVPTTAGKLTLDCPATEGFDDETDGEEDVEDANEDATSDADDVVADDVASDDDASDDADDDADDADDADTDALLDEM